LDINFLHNSSAVCVLDIIQNDILLTSYIRATRIKPSTFSCKRTVVFHRF